VKNILDRIVVDIKEKVETAKRKVPVKQLQSSPLFDRECFSMKKAILAEGASGVIAEFKRRSPSKGVINGEADVKTVVSGYQEAGASCVSILTNSTFFGGCNEYLTAARSVLTIPILRKEFIVDEYQIIEAKSIGADFILLIAEILTKKEVKQFTTLAHSLGLEVLLELHGEDQVHKIIPELDAVGINNRNLKNFEVDIDRSISMAKKLPANTIKIAESGLSDPAVAIRMRESGFLGFLVGEQFMKQDVPEIGCREFISQL
jgi:indole-3-glycerol phosphate synthase